MTLKDKLNSLPLKPRAAGILIGLIVLWLGFSICSALMLSYIATAATTWPYMLHLGIILTLLGLFIIHQLSKNLFNHLTKLAALLKLMRGGGMI